MVLKICKGRGNIIGNAFPMLSWVDFTTKGRVSVLLREWVLELLKRKKTSEYCNERNVDIFGTSIILELDPLNMETWRVGCENKITHVKVPGLR